MSSIKVFKDSILQIIVDFYLKRNKGTDRKVCESYFARLLKSKDGRKKIISLLRNYKNSALQVDKDILQNAIYLIYLVYGEF